MDDSDIEKPPVTPDPIGTLHGAFLPVKEFKDNETIFRELIQLGKLDEAKIFLKNFEDVNINSEDYKGLAAIHYAVKLENQEAVNFLLSLKNMDLKDSVLHAVATKNIVITEIILNNMRLRQLEEEGTYPFSTEYSGNITPLLLAAQCGDFNMIRALMRNGHSLKAPHPPRCNCSDCKKAMKKYSSSLSHIRLDYYKGASSPEYICQASNDPILFGFKLDYKIQECAAVDVEFTAQYLKLGQEVRTFVVDFISEVRNPTEMETILKCSEGYDSHEKNLFPRLQLAVDYIQKEFVANAFVQQVLNAHWYGTSTYWLRLSWASKCIQVLYRTFFIPIIALIMLLAPKSKYGIRCHDPVNKFATYLASYLSFVQLLYFVCIAEKKKRGTSPPSKNLECLIMIFVISFGFTSLNQIRINGVRRYFKSPKQWYDLIIILMFLITFCFWHKSNSDAQNHTGPVPERKYWKSSNSILLHEGFFIISCIMAFGRLFFFFTQSARLGPMQISLGKMGKPIFVFLILWFFLIASFAIPMTNLYVYYEGMKHTDADGETVVMLDSFTNFVNSFGTLFWAIFAKSPTESVNVVIENTSGGINSTIFNHHKFTESVGRFLFGGYKLLVKVALLTTLIAILTNTYKKVDSNADVEWKFSRAKLWLFIINEIPDIPSPFNIIPSRNFLKECKDYFLALFGKTKGAKARFNFQRLFYIEYDPPIHDYDSGEYEELMVELVQRYFCSIESYGKENL